MSYLGIRLLIVSMLVSVLIALVAILGRTLLPQEVGLLLAKIGLLVGIGGGGFGFALVGIEFVKHRLWPVAVAASGVLVMDIAGLFVTLFNLSSTGHLVTPPAFYPLAYLGFILLGIGIIWSILDSSINHKNRRHRKRRGSSAHAAAVDLRSVAEKRSARPVANPFETPGNETDNVDSDK